MILCAAFRDSILETVNEGNTMASRSLFAAPLLLATGIVAQIPASPLPAAELPIVNVGVVIDGSYEGNSYVWNLTCTEILALTEDEFDVRFPEEYYIEAD